MSTKSEKLFATPKLPKKSEALDVWRRVFVGVVEASFSNIDRISKLRKPVPYDRLAPARAYAKFAVQLIKDPIALAKAQKNYVKKWTTLLKHYVSKSGGDSLPEFVLPARGDYRFKDNAWNDKLYFRFIKDAYLLTSGAMLDLVEQTNGLDKQTRARVDFFIRQYLYMISPSNFPVSNPDVVRKTWETCGLNLLGGLANFLTDYAHPNAWVQRRSYGDFTLGKDIAATPGAVIFQNDLMQLIQYTPTTDKVFDRPLLYVPPLVNKYYMLDLVPQSSMFKWLVEQGHTVFAISWVNPDKDHQDNGISDYVLEGPVKAIEVIQDITGNSKVDLFSFCMGGTLSTLALAHLQATQKADCVASATTIGTMLNNEEMGEWSTFISREQMEAFQNHIEEMGMIAGDDLGKLFALVRSNDLIWNSVVDHYLMDRQAPPSDLLHWFADSSNISKAFIAEWSKEVLSGNKLTVPNAMQIGGKSVDLGSIKTPICNIALKEDHVSGWQSVYNNGKYFGGPVRFILGGSGHNAGVINPPSRNKHGFWLNNQKAENAEAWFAKAVKNEGSWWPEWQTWLTAGKRKQPKVDARIPGQGGYPVLEPAPGSYVRG